MANTTYGIKLAFNTDISGAKKELSTLSNQLNNLNKSLDFSKGFSPSVQKAVKDVSALKSALQSAVNVDTGQINFTKFNSSLKRSKTSIDQIRLSLSSFGAEGQAAFENFANSIIRAETPLRGSVALTSKLFESLKKKA